MVAPARTSSTVTGMIFVVRVPGDPEQGLLLEPALLNQLDRAASSSTSLRIAKMRFSYSLVSAST